MDTLAPRVDTARLVVPGDTPNTFFSLISRLQARGWQVKITTDHHLGDAARAQVSIERDNWLGMALPGYAYAFLAHGRAESDVVETLRKLVALDTALTQTFADSFPCQQVHKDGTIREDKALTEQSRRGQLPLLEYQYAQRQVAPPPPYIQIDRGFIQLRTNRTGLLLNQDEVTTLNGIIHDFQHPQ
jgi:hypothetical protein